MCRVSCEVGRKCGVFDLVYSTGEVADAVTLAVSLAVFYFAPMIPVPAS